MKKLVVLALSTVLLVFGLPANAVIKAGAVCKTSGQTKVSGGKEFTCIKKGSKLVWSKGRLAPKANSAQKNVSENQDVSSQSKPNPFQSEVQKALDAKKREADSASDLIKTERIKFEGLSKISCSKNSLCQVGNKGPGGGIVVYAGQIRQAWGQYIEMAPSGWYASVKNKLPGVQTNGVGDPSTYWCENFEMDLTGSVTSQELKSKLGIEIGKGFSNTQLMLAGCKSGAGRLANSYLGGGVSDWFLPSIAELNELCKFASGIITGVGMTNPGSTFSDTSSCGSREMLGSYTALGDFFRGENKKYWSSSENSNNRAWCQRFDDMWTSNWEKSNQFLVRPIRAF